MFLARKAIETLLDEGKLMERGSYCKKYLQQSSYDLRLGSDVYVGGKSAPKKLTEAYPYLNIKPGQFAILTCHEKINLQKGDIEHGERSHMAFIAVRTTFKMQGLVNISGFHVDPTHQGTLLFAVQNVGPIDILLKYLEPTFTIFFAPVEGDIGDPRGKEKDVRDVRFKPKLEGIPLQAVQNLGGGSVTMSELRKEISDLRRIVLIYGPIVVAALIALILDIIQHWQASPAPKLPGS
jgi:dCTP deaminase